MRVSLVYWRRHTTGEEEEGAGGRAGVEIDENSCDGNEECSVLKGLASTPEVCFHSPTGAVQSTWQQTNKSMNGVPSHLVPH